MTAVVVPFAEFVGLKDREHPRRSQLKPTTWMNPSPSRFVLFSELIFSKKLKARDRSPAAAQ